MMRYVGFCSVGEWVGTASVTDAVDAVSLELDLRESGAAFFRGNTAAIDMPQRLQRHLGDRFVHSRYHQAVAGLIL